MTIKLRTQLILLNTAVIGTASVLLVVILYFMVTRLRNRLGSEHLPENRDAAWGADRRREPHRGRNHTPHHTPLAPTGWSQSTVDVTPSS